MGNNRYLKKCLKELGRYNLSEYQYELLSSQIIDVVSNTDGVLEKVLGEPDELVKEVLDINEISSEVNTKGKNRYYSKIGFRKALGISILITIIFQLIIKSDFALFMLCLVGTFIIIKGFIKVMNRSVLFGLVLIVIGIYIAYAPIIYTINTVLNMDIEAERYTLISEVFNVPFLIIELAIEIIFSNFIFVIIGIFALWLVFGVNKHKARILYRDNDRNRFNSSKESSEIEEDVLYINNKLSDVKQTLKGEEISNLNVYTSLGSTEIDLSEFEFKNGMLTINIDLNLGNLSVLLPRDIKLIEEIESSMSDINKLYKNGELENVIKITGVCKSSKLTIK